MHILDKLIGNPSINPSIILILSDHIPESSKNEKMEKNICQQCYKDGNIDALMQ